MADAHAATISEVSRRDFISSKANSTPAAGADGFSCGETLYPYWDSAACTVMRK